MEGVDPQFHHLLQALINNRQRFGLNWTELQLKGLSGLVLIVWNRGYYNIFIFKPNSHILRKIFNILEN